MHRAAFTMANAGFAAIDLGHHAVDIHAFGNTVPVTAMGAGNAVDIGKVGANANTGSFFAAIKVNEARDFTGRELDMEALLEFADRPHGSVGA
ncbi:hypothetical protein KBA01_25090 [Kozakia baliensis]|nr:hypothetical protein KBA01_25090 [Kozakia baliensis]